MILTLNHMTHKNVQVGNVLKISALQLLKQCGCEILNLNANLLNLKKCLLRVQCAMCIMKFLIIQ